MEISKDRPKVSIGVHTSSQTSRKALQMEQFIKWADSKNRAVCRDQKLLRGNVLITESSKNYKVLLAMGQTRKK